LQSKFERVSIVSLNVLQGLFRVSSASSRSLDFWAPKKALRFLFSAEFRFPLCSLIGSVFEKLFFQVCRLDYLEHFLYSKFSQMIPPMKVMVFEIRLEKSF
jgi:hypothetical protein